MSRSCWCAQAGHQMSLCLLVPCAPMSIVCPLPSSYLIIVSVAPAVSPSLPSFVSLYSSPCLQSCADPLSFVCRMLHVSFVFDCAQVFCLPACFSPSGSFFFFFVLYYCHLYTFGYSACRFIREGCWRFFDVCNALYKFLRKPTVAAQYKGEKLKRLLHQRRTGHLDTVSVVLKSHDTLVDSLNQIATKGKGADVKLEAVSITELTLKCISCVMYNVFGLMAPPNIMLQAEQTDLMTAVWLIRKTLLLALKVYDQIQSLRNCGLKARVQMQMMRILPLQNGSDRPASLCKTTL